MSIPPSRYVSGLRDRQKAETHDQILGAVGRKLEAGNLDDLSFAEIAAEAGVGERTVYRHFPTREALMGAFWAWLQTQAMIPPRPSKARVRDSVRTHIDGQKPMRILVVTDAWEPQVNGVVYINDGDWVESCTALAEHMDGTLEIVEWAKLRSWSAIDRVVPESFAEPLGDIVPEPAAA